MSLCTFVRLSLLSAALFLLVCSICPSHWNGILHKLHSTHTLIILFSSWINAAVPFTHHRCIHTNTRAQIQTQSAWLPFSFSPLVLLFTIIRSIAFYTYKRHDTTHCQCLCSMLNNVCNVVQSFSSWQNMLTIVLPVDFLFALILILSSSCRVYHTMVHRLHKIEQLLR